MAHLGARPAGQAVLRTNVRRPSMRPYPRRQARDFSRCGGECGRWKWWDFLEVDSKKSEQNWCFFLLFFYGSISISDYFIFHILKKYLNLLLNSKNECISFFTKRNDSTAQVARTGPWFEMPMASSSGPAWRWWPSVEGSSNPFVGDTIAIFNVGNIWKNDSDFMKIVDYRF